MDWSLDSNSQSSVSCARLRVPYSSQFDLAPASLLMPNASVARKYYSSPSAYERQDGNIFTVGAKRCRCAEVIFQHDGLCSTIGAKRFHSSGLSFHTVKM